MQIIMPILILSSTSFLGWVLLYFMYYVARTNLFNNPGNFHPEDVPTSTLSLIDKFDSGIRVQIVDGPITETRAVTFNLFPSYIVLSQRLFKKMDYDFVEFNIKDLDAIVAHELGHIIPKNNFMLIMWLLISVFLATFAFALYSLLYSLCLSFLSIILLAWFSHLSRNEEYQADAFAVTTASISVEQLIDCLKKLDLVFKREIPIKQRQSIYRKLFRPTLEQRMSRLYQISTFRK